MPLSTSLGVSPLWSYSGTQPPPVVSPFWTQALLESGRPDSEGHRSVPNSREPRVPDYLWHKVILSAAIQ